MEATAKGELKCHRCPVCDGFGCPGAMPGLGGVFESKNFQLNCAVWGDLRKKAEQEGKLSELLKIEVTPDKIRCGPVTGAVENIGYSHERDFYYPYLKNAAEAGYGLCVGDGCPDEKLHYGIEAVKVLAETAKSSTQKAPIKAAFFLKPYPINRLLERLTWIIPYAEYIGIDIDSYNIVTMRNLVNLEKKTAAQLNAFRKEFKVPFVIKGVFTDDDIELVRQVKPDVVYISNHGGRVETRIGSTGDFLVQHASELKKYCKQIWVDGGIRTLADVQTALYYGADQVIIARPFIRATFDDEKLQLL